MKPKSVLITGCSSGIGFHVANTLKDRGYRIFASARKSNDVEELKRLGLESVQLDLANSASIDSALDFVLESTGGELYGLFNNGAFGIVGAVEDLSRDAMRDLFEANLFGTHELTTRVIPVMRQQGFGRIIQNSSILGFVTLKFRGAYNASKYALEGLTDTLRMELEGSGIHVSLIEPGPIESKFRKNAYLAYRKYIDKEHSYFRDLYDTQEIRMQTEEPVVPFTLGPEAVYKKVVHALESKRPKARYFVTFPTYLFGTLKRLLPDRVLDSILIRI
ncbi:MAG: SDR family NAD(P)-dependent oxidoreductase [Gammaproteobacteria bacterium]|nr:SDR family NAD(P)-dependent oxidoreductase [Gammaproteobacteria bacterium]NIN62447.1 SDR family NAD(P)-dependent oxidoreductase [Gammaproteobacteria bacterium]NIO63042.1 SDR family NAD(P)-dependent oxidoreductase [Gammaproteobacteria bacterium]NIP49011.1 SDR family NAD(P)-dependent oxidoreductase [Gammaproteobacteria bacterium]NIQ09467.1 SDR family NAD(P)-dependent oxidoreductase [Gammaproteobacteria bacterium]